jgi:hypothetical protein
MSTTQTQEPNPKEAYDSDYDKAPDYISIDASNKQSLIDSRASTYDREAKSTRNRTSQPTWPPGLLHYNQMFVPNFNQELKHESVLYCRAKAAEYIRTGEDGIDRASSAVAPDSSLTREERKQKVIRDFWKLLWHIDVKKDHGDDYDRRIVNQVLSNNRWETTVFGVKGRKCSYTVWFVSQNMREDKWDHHFWSKEEIFDFLMSYDSATDYNKSLMGSPTDINSPSIFNTDIDDFPQGGAVAQSDKKLRNLLTNKTYSYRVSSIVRPVDKNENILTVQARANTQATQIIEFLGDGTQIGAIVDTSSHFDLLLASPAFDSVINMFTASTQSDPAFKMNYLTYPNYIAPYLNYKSRFFTEESPPQGQIFYVEFPNYESANHNNTLSHLFCIYPLVLNILPDTDNEKRKGILRVLITYIKGAQTVEVQTGENIAGCVSKIIGKVKKAFNIIESNNQKEKTFISKESGDVCQVLDTGRKIKLVNNKTVATAAQVAPAPEVKYSDNYKKMLVSIDYNLETKGLGDDVDIELIYNNDSHKLLLLKNESLDNPLEQFKNLIKQATAEEAKFNQEVHNYKGQRNNILNRAVLFHQKIYQILTPANYRTPGNVIATKQTQYIQVLKDGMQIMALLPFVPKRNSVVVTQGGVTTIQPVPKDSILPVCPLDENILKADNTINPSYMFLTHNNDIQTQINSINTAGVTNEQKNAAATAGIAACKTKLNFIETERKKLQIPPSYVDKSVFRETEISDTTQVGAVNLADVYLEKQILFKILSNANMQMKKKIDDVWSCVNIAREIMETSISSIFCKLGTRFSTYWCLELVANTFKTIKAFYPDLAVNYIKCLKEAVSFTAGYIGKKPTDTFEFGMRILGILQGTPIPLLQNMNNQSEWYQVFPVVQGGGALTMNPVSHFQSQYSRAFYDEALGAGGSEETYPYGSGIYLKKPEVSSHIPYLSALKPSVFNQTKTAHPYQTYKNINKNKSKVNRNQTQKRSFSRTPVNTLSQTSFYDMDDIFMYKIQSKKRLRDTVIDFIKLKNRYKNQPFFLRELEYFEHVVCEINDLYTLVYTFYKLVDVEDETKIRERLRDGLRKIFKQKSSVGITSQHGGGTQDTEGFSHVTTTINEQDSNAKFCYYPTSFQFAYISVIHSLREQIAYIAKRLRRQIVSRELHLQELNRKIATITQFVEQLNRDSFEDFEIDAEEDNSNQFILNIQGVLGQTSSVIAPPSSSSTTTSLTASSSLLPPTSSTTTTTTTTMLAPVSMSSLQVQGTAMPMHDRNVKRIRTITGASIPIFTRTRSQAFGNATNLARQNTSITASTTTLGNQQQQLINIIPITNPSILSGNLYITPVHHGSLVSSTHPSGQQNQYSRTATTTRWPFGGGRRQTWKRQTKRKNKTSKNKKLKA